VTRKQRDHHLQQAIYSYQNKQLDDANQICNYLLTQNPDDAEALNILASVYIQERLYKTARKYLERCVKLKTHPICLNNLGVVYKNLNYLAKAEQCFLQAIEIEANNIDANLNLGILLYEQQRFSEAYQYFANIDASKCNNYSYFYFYGRLKLDNGEFNAAQELFTKALSLPDQELDEEVLNDVKEFLSYSYLAMGDLANGWSLYNYRRQGLKERKRLIELGCDLPFWTGEDLPASNLLVVAEDGVGDELMYASNINLLENKVQQIYLECDSRLQPLYARVYPNFIFIKRNDNVNFKAAVAKCDHCVLLGDLPRYLNPRMQFNHENTRFLLPDLNNSAKLRKKLLYSHGNKILVGVSYYTSAQNAASRMPPQEFWEGIFKSCPEIDFINLQENNQTAANKRGFLYANNQLYQLNEIDLYNDINSLADLICAMDFVVSISNYIIHLTGRLGKPCALILPKRYNCRWLLTKDKAPWYPTATLVRSDDKEGWSSLQQKMLSTIKFQLRNI
jgi:tetratricopeptide (TPR) repeat protein